MLTGPGALAAYSIKHTLRGAALRHAPQAAATPLTLLTLLTYIHTRTYLSDSLSVSLSLALALSLSLSLSLAISISISISISLHLYPYL